MQRALCNYIHANQDIVVALKRNFKNIQVLEMPEIYIDRIRR